MYKYIFLFSATTFLLVSCSSGSKNAITPAFENIPTNINQISTGVTDIFPDGSPSAGIGTLGVFELAVNNVDVTASLTSLRNGALTDVLEIVDITNFLQMAPCTDCVKIKSVSLNMDGNLVVSMGIKHPFDAGDPLKPPTGKNRADLHVFNVEGIVVSDAVGISFTSTGETIAGLFLTNSDGFSGYLDSALDEIFLTEASIHPYMTHFDDYSAGNYNASNPTGFESVTDPGPSGNLVMAMGTDYDYKDYTFAIDGSMSFIFAVGCTYAVSAASKSQRFIPEYRCPQHNKKAASEISVEIINNQLKGGITTSSVEMEISVVDINHGVTVGTALNEMFSDSSVGAISVEVPGVTSGAVDVPSTPTGGTGHDPSDPLIFPITIYNTNGAADGIYTGLVKVVDSYSPGLNESSLLNGHDGIKRTDPSLNPLSGTFAIDEFATYQTFSIDVITSGAITVLIPNGGEQWEIGTDEEITWTSEDVFGTVFIEYSKDNFVSDINLIAPDEANDYSYLWTNIPNDPSDTVRVRISSTDNPAVNDISDYDFEIYMIQTGWARNWGPTAFTGGKGVAVDSDGNSFVTGKFMGSIDFNPDPSEEEIYTSNGGYDVYVCKYDINGEFQWARTWGGSGWEYNRGVDVDTYGNVYIPGYFESSVDFDPDDTGTDVHASNGAQDAFLTKFDTDGNFIWAKTWGGSSSEDAYGAETDDMGNVYVTGQFRQSVNFNPDGAPDYHSSNGGQDVYLMMFDSSGNFQWAKTWGGSAWDYGNDVAVDSFGDVYSVGWFAGTVNFNPDGLDNHTASGDPGVFLSKFDSSGNFQWARTWGGSSYQNYDFAIGVNTDNSSNIFVAGRFLGTVDFDPSSGGIDEHISQGDVDAFISSFDYNGDFRWARTWGGPVGDYARGVATDESGNIFVGGHYANTVDFDPDPGLTEIFTSQNLDVYLSKFDASGNLVWVRTWQAFGNDRSGLVAVDQYGSAYFTGILQGTVDFAPASPPCDETPDYHSHSGECDAFLIKVISDGCW